jgi:hypothetical protein
VLGFYNFTLLYKVKFDINMFLGLYRDSGMNIPINPKTKIPYTVEEYNAEFGTNDSILGNMVRNIIGTNLPNLSGVGVNGPSMLNSGLPESGNTAWLYAKQNLSNPATQTKVVDIIKDSLNVLIEEGIVAAVDAEGIYTNGTFNLAVYLTKPNGVIVQYIQKLWS